MNRYLPIYLLLALLLGSCNDWFDIRPQGDIDEERLFSDETAFLNALAGVYTQLRENSLYGEQLSVSSLEFMAQNFIPDDETGKSLTDYDYSTAENQKMIREIWRDMYNAIANCNKALEHILATDVVFNFTDQREIITGELYALRGALHFELLRMFHPHPSVNPSFKGMPYMTAYGTTTGPALSTDELLENSIRDLQQATSLLYQTDPLFTAYNSNDEQPGKISRKHRTFHMNYYAVTAELARIYLYKGDYQQAYAYADSTFNHIRQMNPSYQVFYYFGPGKYNSDKSFSREHIFGIASGPTGLTQVAEELFETRQIETCKAFNTLYPSVKDTRYRDWFKLKSNTTDCFILSEKFSRESLLSGYTSTNSSDNKELPVRIPFIKLGEVALIAAEALNELGRTDEAAEWVVELQDNRDISFVKDLKNNGELTQKRLAEEIRAEYHREFYGEGQLFFFHKRMNDARLTRYDGTPFDMPASNYTFPIPANALSAK